MAQVPDSMFFRNHRGGPVQRITDDVLEFVHIPGTAMFADHRF